MTRNMINASEATIRAVSAAMGRAALFDDKITEADTGRLAVFAEALEPLRPEHPELLDAVTAHYRATDRTIAAADIAIHIKSARRDRHDRLPPAERQAREDALDAARGFGTPSGDRQLGGLPIAGADGAPIPGAYAAHDAINLTCTTCNAEPGEPCTNPGTGSPRKTPCLNRLKAGHRQARDQQTPRRALDGWS